MTTEEKIKIAQELIKRAVEISDTTEHDVFCEFAPHVNNVTIGIHRGGWENNRDGCSFDIDFDKGNVDLQVDAINAVLDTLEG